MKSLLKYLDTIRQSTIYRYWEKKLRRVSFPGFEKVPLWDVLLFLFKEIQRDTITIRASAIAFSFFIAIFPTIIFLFTLIPYIPIPGVDQNILGLLKGFLPKDAFNLVNQTAIDLISEQRGGLLSAGFIMALYFSTNGVCTMIDSFDKAYSTFKKRRNYFQTRLVALKLLFFLSLLLLVSILLIIAGGRILDYLLGILNMKSTFEVTFFNIIRWLVIILLMFFSYSFIYYYGPAVKKKFKFISAGSTLATILTILISVSFSYYVNNFSQYNRFYGSLGTIIALLLWFYVNSFALLIGFELNASIVINKNILLDKNDANRDK